MFLEQQEDCQNKVLVVHLFFERLSIHKVWYLQLLHQLGKKRLKMEIILSQTYKQPCAVLTFQTFSICDEMPLTERERERESERARERERAHAS